MRIDLSGRTAIVTGSTEGIGLAIARGLAAAGASVVVTGRTRDKLDRAVEQIGGDARGVAADLGESSGMAPLIAAVPRADIVVSNLGVFEPGDIFGTDDAVWDRAWRLNVMPGVRLARAYLPAMRDAGWGRMILIASESAYNVPADIIHYGVSKTAIVSLARGLAKRMAGTGVTVNSVLPGPTMTEGMAVRISNMSNEASEPFDELAARVVTDSRPSSIIRRPIEVDEVANMVIYVASDQASATTGAALRVDGGVIDSLL